MRALGLSAIVLAGCTAGGMMPSNGDDAAAVDAQPGAHPDAHPGSGSPDAQPGSPDAAPTHAIDTVFLILMENHNWSEIKGSSSAMYINHTLLAQGAHAENYQNVPNLHPSEPNYIWLEAGNNYNLSNDNDPSSSHSIARGTPHLAAQLEAAGISWKSYQENMPSGCPLHSSGLYGAKHDPFVFFKDMTDDESASSQHCIDHNVDFSHLHTDLSNDQVARYNFITPNLCDDMHGASGCPSDEIKAGDDWLAQVVPMIQASPVYQRGHAAILITWDESENGDFAIGMIALSPYARAGQSTAVAMSHSSTVRSMQEIFGLSPWLGDAANANDLSSMFTQFP